MPAYTWNTGCSHSKDLVAWSIEDLQLLRMLLSLSSVGPGVGTLCIEHRCRGSHYLSQQLQIVPNYLPPETEGPGAWGRDGAALRMPFAIVHPSVIVESQGLSSLVVTKY